MMGKVVINCGTCQARLVVRHEKAVVQIHPCPRCGSMVMIDTDAMHGSNHLSGGRRRGTRSSMESSAAEMLLANEFELVDNLLDGRPVAYDQTIADEVPSPQSACSERETMSGSAEATSIPVAGSADAVARRSLIRTITLGVLSGVVGALIATWLWWPLLDRRIQSEADANARSQSAPKNATRPLDNVGDSSTSRVGVASSNVVMPPREEVLKPVIPELPPDPMNSEVDDNEARDILPPTMDATTNPMGPSSTTAWPVMVSPDIFADKQKHPSVRLDIQPAGTSQVRAVVLNQSVQSMELPSTNLRDFCRLMQQMVGTPICIDPLALAMARTELSAPLSVRTGQQSFGEVLSTALRPLHLAYQVEGSYLVVRHRAMVEQRPSEIRLAADDLVGTDLTPTMLIELLNEFVPLAGEEDRVVCEQDAIVVHASPRDQFRVLSFLEQWRAVRGVPTRTIYGPWLRDHAARCQQAWLFLNKNVVPNWPPLATFPELVDHWQRQMACDILVDWPELARHGLDHQAQWRLRIDPCSFAELLSSLEAGGLTFAILGESCVAITAAESSEGFSAVEFHSLRGILPDFTADGDPEGSTSLVQEIEDSFRQQLELEGLASRGLVMTIWLDRRSQHLIARMPFAWHRRLAQGLDRLRRVNSSIESSARLRPQVEGVRSS